MRLGLHSRVSSSGLQNQNMYTAHLKHYKTNNNKDSNVEVLDTKAVMSPVETACKFKVNTFLFSESLKSQFYFPKCMSGWQF